ncbi:ACP phosphodiesterase [Denitratisoma oestradiolicum]|uniref:acyl carrier protein phosphodiesterase n=1 Tax=Denitratisoma oestradiolicum TaxID=311182 RepID=UPI0011A4A3E5|nr:ACP phosphodiesterase [Denitratisoma oestradiolicum]TWO79852.1 hypothetical protein CBW56_12740 [Denitratisoma oestradiolicum]
MNFLAHAWLAGEGAEDRLGALIGDFVKGPLPGLLPTDLAAGVELHRRVDSYADDHPAFQRSRGRVSRERRRYAGIMVDMFYDHFLALHWDHFGREPLADYVAELYDQANQQIIHLPPTFRRTLSYMQEENWLLSYRTTDAIVLTLDRLAHYRLRQPNRLGGGGEELLADYRGYEEDFFEFIADARRYCDGLLAARLA